MPATTVAQLTTALATAGTNGRNYIEPGTTLAPTLNEIGPRVYALGDWLDLKTERTYLGADGYISLDRDIEAVLSATINGRPATIRSQFHDVRLVGERTYLPEVFGLIDNGFSPIKREIATIQNVDDEDDITPITTLHICSANGTAALSAAYGSATLTVIGLSSTGVKITGSLDTGDTNVVVTFATGVCWIESIVGTSMPANVELRTDIDDAETCVAEVAAGTDVVRYRRYRVSNASDDTYVSILGKRAWQNVSASTDLVHLGNLTAWKHALLGKLEEDNADLERASYHWNLVSQVLEQESQHNRGGAKPSIQLSPWGVPSVPAFNHF